jgi:D-beta-D-heptose 7-phosphate kinase / D-beta-D-heptose 1-phosphate adenosyltransferase
MGDDLHIKLQPATPPRVWVIGDVMLDRYLVGGVERISPEAPVPVLRLERTFARVGGAANVAQNVAALGGLVALGGAIGADEDGAELRRLVADAGVGGGGLVARPAFPTTVKTRALAGMQQLLRIDQEQRGALAEGEIDDLLERLRAEIAQPDLILLSDYDKGVVSAALVARLRALVPKTPIFVDPKGADYARYAGASLITPNVRELQLATGIDVHDDASLVAAARALQGIVPTADVVVTRGARGMSLVSRDGTILHSPARARRVFDVTGAGDTAIAALAMGRALALSWSDALHAANQAAAIAVAKIGAAPVYRTELLSALGHDHFGAKLIDRAGLPELRRTASLLGQRLVFTNGCFDVLHVGHLRLLQEARAQGDLLLVAVNSDASVRRLKGTGRPIVAQEDRAALLAGLDAVDFVTIFEEDTPAETIQLSRPDVLVKGGDYRRETIVGAAEVEGWGGRVHIVALMEGRSTTRMIDAMKPPAG